VHEAKFPVLVYMAIDLRPTKNHETAGRDRSAYFHVECSPLKGVIQPRHCLAKWIFGELDLTKQDDRANNVSKSPDEGLLYSACSDEKCRSKDHQDTCGSPSLLPVRPISRFCFALTILNTPV
jgi:hypothetical protein